MAHPETTGVTGRITLALLIGLGAALARAQPLDHGADALLAIDQHRSSVVERVVESWGPSLAKSNAHVSVDELRTRLLGLRADRLLAASLAGTLDAVRAVVGVEAAVKPGLLQTKALGDSAFDVVYTPLTPCRLVETRGTFPAVYQGGGAFTSGAIRTYAVQGGNGVCLSQLPAGLDLSAVQLQVFAMPTTAGSGDVEILPQGASFGSTATMVYIGTIPFNTVSTNARINLANHQISVQVRGGGAHLAIDVVGYFKRPANYGGTHTVSGINATDGGGFSNVASGDYSTVSGGRSNQATGFSSTVAGGESHQVAGPWAAVGGGFNNFAGSNFAVISGGIGNSALANYVSIGGGENNQALGLYATIVGGHTNQANGQGATVAGGAANTASGTGSFAAGTLARATHPGCFVWSDMTSGINVTSCFGANEFVARATGGFYFFTGGTSDNTYTGAQLQAGAGAWTAYSDRDGKANVRAVDPLAVLETLVTVPISTWNWKSQDAAIRHIGPMAQDFSAAFELGETPIGISTIDADGVALAAIQGLHQLIQDKDAKIKAQQRDISALQERLASIETLRDELHELKAALAEFQRSQDTLAELTAKR